MKLITRTPDFPGLKWHQAQSRWKSFLKPDTGVWVRDWWKLESVQLFFQRTEVTLTPNHPVTPVLCGISLSKQLVSHYASPSRTAHTRSPLPGPVAIWCPVLKSGGSSWEGWARYVQQTVEPAGQWAVLSLFTNHCQTPVPGLLLPLTSHTLHTHTHTHSTPGWPSQWDTFKWRSQDWIYQVAEHFRSWAFVKKRQMSHTKFFTVTVTVFLYIYIIECIHSQDICLNGFLL